MIFKLHFSLYSIINNIISVIPAKRISKVARSFSRIQWYHCSSLISLLAGIYRALPCPLSPSYHLPTRPKFPHSSIVYVLVSRFVRSAINRSPLLHPGVATLALKRGGEEMAQAGPVNEYIWIHKSTPSSSLYQCSSIYLHLLLPKERRWKDFLSFWRS